MAGFKDEFAEAMRKNEAFAVEMLKQQATTLQVLKGHGDKIDAVSNQLDRHLEEHRSDLRESLVREKEGASKRTELWIGTLVGLAGVGVAVAATLLRR